MIYCYVYPSAMQNPGGGEALLLKTKEYVEKLGVSARLFDMWNDRFQKGDLLHVFGSVKEALGLMEVAKSKGVKIVLSPIIWYNWQSSFWVPYSIKERFLCLVRQGVKSMFPMMPSARKRMMELADLILASSEAEAEQIRRYFLIAPDRIKVVTYGADEAFLDATPTFFEQRFGIKNFILTVGRIEPRKNQLNLIRAMKGGQRPLVIIGEAVSHHQSYYNRCKDAADGNVYFLGALPQNSQELRSAFAACSVFTLPTWFETPGLAALEAALSGAKIVITRAGATREYFGDFVDYIDPADIQDIRNKIEVAYQRSKTTVLRDYVSKRYLWQHMAEQTIRAYQKLGTVDVKTCSVKE